MKRRINPHGRLLVSVVVLIAFAGVVILLVPPLASQTTEEPATGEASATAAPPQPKIEAKKNVLDGREVGEVCINDKVVIRLQQAAGGFSSFERAEKVVSRLQDLVAAGVKSDAFHAGTSHGYPAVLAGEELVITADQFHAHINGVAPSNLAKTWAGQIRSALGGTTGTPETPAATTGEPTRHEEVFREEDYGDKWVPILSAGDGIYVGAARVAGPKTKLEQVQGVALIELNWDKLVDVKIRVYVPISTKVPGKSLARVQRCNVTAVGDFRL